MVSLASLHSTMFLLIRDLFFTCFNVFQSLHSTMFLLILTTISLSDAWRKIFTFHNVSINTENGNEYPTLFFRFTFHNVSINTLPQTRVSRESVFFTFHNVSINTRAPHSPIIHRLFYHFLSTLSFTIILYTK